MKHLLCESFLVLLLGVVTSTFGCKDEQPCDQDQDSIGTACYPKREPAEGGSPSAAEGGAPSSAAAGGAMSEGGWPGGIEPPGNPDAMFGTQCVTNKDCSESAPICLIAPGPLYCSQIDCLEGEVNANSCPDGWVCFKLDDNTRSACLNPN